MMDFVGEKIYLSFGAKSWPRPRTLHSTYYGNRHARIAH